MEIAFSRSHGLNSESAEDVRCGCGALLARLVDGRIELKCRRCKRVVGVAEITRLNACCGLGGSLENRRDACSQ